MEEDKDVAEGVNTTRYRMLDTRIGRWMSVDPAAAKYYSWSPYNLSMDNPIANSDPSGATVSPTVEGFNALNDGLNRTLGENHGFTRNEVSGQLQYNRPDNVNYTELQQEIINRLTTLIDHEANVEVFMVTRAQQLPGLDEGLTLGALGINGVTVLDVNRETSRVNTDVPIKVFLASDPIGVTQVDGEIATFNLPSYHKGLNSLH